jgi:1-acyl-sn-glycerol-3-phosphate acyltransferase
MENGDRRKQPVNGAELSLLRALAGKRVLIAGATGFIGKVTLAMLLDRCPDLGCVYILLRQRAGESAGARLTRMIAGSPAFDPLRAAHGEGSDEFVRDKLVAIAGDVTQPGWGIASDDLARLAGVDVIVNISGLVSFNESLDESIAVNAEGARNAALLAVRLRTRLVQVSTAYVAGTRSGTIAEREPIVGAYPRQHENQGSFNAVAELQAANDFIGAARASADACAGPGQRSARHRAETEIVSHGLQRARYWGWPNIYCYTKSIGEQLIAATPDLDYTIVRPSIVESALDFPFPGWNEGLNTSAPVILAMCSGHVLWPIHRKAALDIIPVDFVAAGLLLATGAILSGSHEQMYHLSSSDTNPFAVRRCMRYIAEYRSRHYRDHADGSAALQWLRTRMKSRAVPDSVYRAVGVPGYRNAVGLLLRALRTAGVKRPPRALKRLERKLAQVERVIETFLPFIHDIDCVFQTGHIRALHARLPPAERAQLRWNPERIDWRSYWFDVHTEGLRKWVFPALPAQAGQQRPGLSPLDLAIRRLLSRAQKMVYARLFRTRVHGAHHVPERGGYLIASNHASHLDMGLIKHALGQRELIALAARDYFFQRLLRRYFFTHYTNLLAFDRNAQLRKTLQAAGKVLARGHNLLLFPEGTRTPNGQMSAFKPSVGYLALNNDADILPVFVHGTFEALPRGALLPRRLDLAISIGAPIACAELKRQTRGLLDREAYRAAAAIVETAVRRLGESHAP